MRQPVPAQVPESELGQQRRLPELGQGQGPELQQFQQELAPGQLREPLQPVLGPGLALLPLQPELAQEQGARLQRPEREPVPVQQQESAQQQLQPAPRLELEPAQGPSLARRRGATPPPAQVQVLVPTPVLEPGRFQPLARRPGLGLARARAPVSAPLQPQELQQEWIQVE